MLCLNVTIDDILLRAVDGHWGDKLKSRAQEKEEELAADPQPLSPMTRSNVQSRLGTPSGQSL